MHRRLVITGIAILLFAALAAAYATSSAANQHATKPAAATSAEVFDERQALAALRQSIQGRESEPARKVFRNVKHLGDMPADRLLRVMEFGYSRSLGVSCDHCHVATDWASDEKDAKRIARAMATMAKELNESTLAEIPELVERKPKSTVNCTTCHRGEIKPALSLAKPSEAAPPAR